MVVPFQAPDSLFKTVENEDNAKNLLLFDLGTKKTTKVFLQTTSIVK